MYRIAIYENITNADRIITNMPADIINNSFETKPIITNINAKAKATMLIKKLIIAA